MIPRVGEAAPSREEIERLLDLAVRAPNHHRSEPWRFYVFAGAGRDVIARAIADEAISSGGDPKRALADAAAKVERAPVIVVFTMVFSDDAKVIDVEDVVSVGMAMQNFLLGAHASGLGAMLRTGPAAYHPAIAEQLELATGERVLGMIYLGYPAGERDTTERKPATDLTRWYGFD